MSTMQAVRIHGFGGTEQLVFDEVERPEPGPGQALVRVVGSSVNPVDYKIRQGGFPPVGEDDLPLCLGRDVAGTVVALGEGCEGVAVGDPVYGMPAFEHGSYAEYALLGQDELARAPRTLNLADAGAVPLAALTAWQALFDHGGLRSGERVLIHGGSGGVGHFAVQLARAKGAIVHATASGVHQMLLRQLGAETAIDYESERFEDVAEDIDLVIDLIGGETQARSGSVRGERGRLISTLTEPDASGQGEKTGSVFMTEPSGETLAEIASMIDEGKMRVSIAERFALADVAQAQDRMERGGFIGKLLLEIPSPDEEAR